MQISQSLATFTSKQELNDAVRKHLYYNAHRLTKSAKTLLLILSQFSCKIPGVAWPKSDVLIEATKLKKATFWRALGLLEKFGIIKRVSGRGDRRKKTGEVGGNIYLIQPTPEDQVLPSSLNETKSETKENRHGEDSQTPVAPTSLPAKCEPDTKISLSVISSEENLKTVKREIRIPNSRVWKKVPKNVPEEFAHPVMRDTADGQVAFRLWGKVLLVDKLCGIQNDDTLAEIATATWKRTKLLYKERDFNKFCGVFFGAFKRATADRFPLLEPYLYTR